MSAAWCKFLDLLKQSVITQALVTFCLVLTCCIIWIRGQDPTTGLYQLTVLVIGFWFGSKIGYNQGITALSASINSATAAQAVDPPASMVQPALINGSPDSLPDPVLPGSTEDRERMIK
jgi:hypothetical protein